MVPRRILIIQGHPDVTGDHFCHALADCYDAGASAAAHEVRRVDVARLDFTLLRSKKEWDSGSVPPALAAVQKEIAWADHLVLIFPPHCPAHHRGERAYFSRPERSRVMSVTGKTRTASVALSIAIESDAEKQPRPRSAGAG